MVYKLNVDNPNLSIYFDENCLINTSFGKRKISNIKEEDFVFFNNLKVLGIQNEKNFDFKNELTNNIVFENEFNDVLYFYCRDLSNIFKSDKNNNFQGFFDNQEKFNDLSLFIYNMVNNEKNGFFDELKEKLKEHHVANNFLKEESMVINYKIFNNLFTAYCETFDLKNLDNLEQIQYIDSKFNEMFKYGLKRQDMTKDMFKELFETYYNNEMNYLSYN